MSPDPIVVVLEPYEVVMAAGVGVRRQVNALSKNLPDRHGLDPSDGKGWNIHIEGACGELAAAKALDLYWGGSVGTFRRGGDVVGLEVRCRSEHYYDLIIRDVDDSYSAYVLVTGKAPEFRVIGWIWGWEGRRKEWLRSYGGRARAYFVPKSALRRFDDPDFPPNRK